MSFRNPSYMQNATKFTYAAVDDRFIIDTLFQEGILNYAAGQGLVIQRPAGAAMNVRVPVLDSVIKGDDATNQGSYLVRMDVAEDVDIPAANATNPRVDLLVVEVVDSSYRTIVTGGFEGARLRVVAGTPAATPVAPTLPPTAIPLAQITVPANAVSIVTANIVDVRTQAGAASLKIGTQAASVTQAARNATPASGELVFNTTTNFLEAADTFGTWGSTRPLAYWIGRGTDGDVTIAANTTLSRDMEYRNLTVLPGVTLNTGGYRIAVQGVCWNRGTISCDGLPGSGGTAQSSYNAALAVATVGGAGGGFQAASKRLGFGGTGGNGGWVHSTGGGSGGGGGTGGLALAGQIGGAGGGGGNRLNQGSYPPAGSIGTNTANPTLYPTLVLDVTSWLGSYGLIMTNAAVFNTLNGGTGGSGGGPGGTASNVALTDQSGAGGGGGGILVVVADLLVNDGTISARGGQGGAQANPDAPGYSAPGGGGGGGGIITHTRRLLQRTGSSFTVAGGAAGNTFTGLAITAGSGSVGSIYNVGI